MKVIEFAFTGYPVTDIKRARAFYENVLGLKATRVYELDGKFWIEYDIGAATLAVSNVSPTWKAAKDGVCAAFEVEDFDAALETLRKAKVALLGDVLRTPGCSMAFISDPDGNPITIHKRKAG